MVNAVHQPLIARWSLSLKELTNRPKVAYQAPEAKCFVNKNKEVHIAYINPVEPIGEMGYFQDGIRTASVRATKQSELLRAPYLNLTHYFEHVPRVANAFVEVIQRRQKNTK